MPRFLTTQASMAVLPLITVTLSGVEASMKGLRVVVVLAVGAAVVWPPPPAT